MCTPRPALVEELPVALPPPERFSSGDRRQSPLTALVLVTARSQLRAVIVGAQESPRPDLYGPLFCSHHTVLALRVSVRSSV